MSNVIPTHFSLVKYSTPVLVSVAGKKNKDGKSGKDKPSAQALKESHKTEDTLSQILPPKEYVLENG